MRTLNATLNQQETGSSLFQANQTPIFRSNSKNIPQNKQDEEQCVKLLQKMISFQPQLSKKLDQMLEEVDDKNYSKGIGYYNSKNLLMMEYLLQLQFYQLFKINGEDLTKGQGLELYQRMAYLKTLLTKLSPVQKKLEYQKNKLLKYSDVVDVKADRRMSEMTDQKQISQEEQLLEQSEGGLQQEQSNKHVNQQSEEEDELMYQPRPQALLKVKTTKKKEQEDEGKYVAPKISAVLSKQDKIKRKLQLQDERNKVNLIRKYRDDLQDHEEARQKGVNDQLTEKIKRKFREKQSIQQQNFIRFPETKKQKMWKKKIIRSYERSNPLIDELKDIQKIRQIFTQKQDDPNIPSKVLKRKKQQHKPKKGAKKRKIE